MTPDHNGPRPLRWGNVVNVVCATGIVGSQACFVLIAAAWAAGSLLRLESWMITLACGVALAGGLLATAFFFRLAKRSEPFR